MILIAKNMIFHFMVTGKQVRYWNMFFFFH